MINSVIDFILHVIESFGYIGIFFFMAIESSFLPLPSEIVMIPAGYLVWQGKMNAILAIMAGTFGSLAGALCNYYIALKIGRIFVVKYGKYVLLKERSLSKTESFFNRHGEISTFIGRLIPVIRHYISLPAGLAKMNLKKFCFFTLLGALLWVSILVAFGYWLGDAFSNVDLHEIAGAFGGSGEKDSFQRSIKGQLREVLIYLLCAVAIIAIAYIIYVRYRRDR